MDQTEFIAKEKYSFSDLLALMDFLRSPEGCPWDRKQSLASLQPYLLEECYECLAAFNEGNVRHHGEELGDVLLQVVFQAQIASEHTAFSIADVIDALVRKLVHRHSHIFGVDQASNADEVKVLWIRNKEKEAQTSTQGRSPLSEIKLDQSPLHVAFSLQKGAAKYGFDWPDHQGAAEKVLEELDEVKAAITEPKALPSEKSADSEQTALLAELGDLFFAVVNLSRKLGLEPETALSFANNKFLKRFRMMEDLASERGLELANLSLEQQNQLWNEAKRKC